MSRRDRIKDIYSDSEEAPELAAANFSPVVLEPPKERQLAGPVRTMGLALDRIEDEKIALRSALAAGATIIDLDPGTIEPSHIRDRLPESESPAFEALKNSIAERGQEVPILVRPHPLQKGRYQVAYGHRRLRAAAALGRKVRAVVRAMSDIELVVAQGVENALRQDLSFIERALFAHRLENAGFERKVILDALGVDKGEVSKLISVASAIPGAVVEAIGPAPKAGRRRWLAFVEKLGNPAAAARVEKQLGDVDWVRLDSDARFARALALATESANQLAAPGPSIPAQGVPGAKISRTKKTMTLAFDLAADAEFPEFVAARLDGLYQDFLSRAGARG